MLRTRFDSHQQAWNEATDETVLGRQVSLLLWLWLLSMEPEMRAKGMDSDSTMA